jgi:GMP synthase-like glutamine amidotransferase
VTDGHGEWVVLQHVGFEGPGSIEDAARRAGLGLRLVRLQDGDALPDVNALAGVIVMGGPMGALDDATHPFLAGERALLKACVDRSIPVLGVCLGAQLLATACGARLWRLPRTERAVGSVRLTAAGLNDPVVGAPLAHGVTTTRDPELLEVVHWHRDTFSLPPGAVHLARTGLAPHQAFRLGSTAYGLQFHVEASAAWGDEVREHWRDDVPLPPDALERVAISGAPLLDAFFALALERR